ncbi:MAG: exopolyphosphatase [Actinomycetota bacterium]
MSADAIAAIDLGSHSTRLLIERAGEPVVRLVELTKLSEGMRETGVIQPTALDRVRSALTAYRREMDTHDVVRVRVAATAAARDAKNGAEFIAMVTEAAGTAPDILTGDAEAELTFLGATAELDPERGPFLVIDIGGRSTEFAYGHHEFEGGISLEIGSVRLSEEYLESDPPRADELSACVTVTGAWLDDVDRELPQARRARTVIGVAGTVSAAVAVEIGLMEYDRDQMHHFELSRDAAEDVFRTLATESRADRAHNPGLPPGRVDTIVGGMSILVKTMRHFDLDGMLASEADILDGLVRSIR